MALLKKKEPLSAQRPETSESRSAARFDSERYIRDFAHLTGAELGTLLGAIAGQLDYAHSQASPEIREHAMRVALKAAERATALSRNLRYFASHTSYEVQPVDLSQLLINTIELVEKELSAHSIYPSVTVDAVSYATVDDAAVRQCLLNLIAYCTQSMRLGGRLVFHLRQMERQIEITLNDSGAGVYPPDLGNILEGFTREITAADAGLLGLIVTKTIAESQGGLLKLSSTQRGGTTFHLCLPRHKLSVLRTPFKEKRRTRRIQLRLPSEIGFDRDSHYLSEIRTLGKHGAFVSIPDLEILSRLPPSTRLHLKIYYFQKESFEIPRARVVNHISRNDIQGVGIEFEELSDKARKVLAAILKGHSS